jgi:hypothetical protein
MTAYNQVPYFSVTMASGVTLSDAIDLGRGYTRLSLSIPTMTSGTDIFIKACETYGGTYKRFRNRISTGTADPAAMYITSSVTQCFVPLEYVNARFIKIELSTAMTATAATFSLICS